MEEHQDLIQDPGGEIQDQDDAFAEGWEEEAPNAGEEANQPENQAGRQEPPTDGENAGGEGDEKAGGEEKPDRAEDHPAEQAGGETPAKQTWEVNHLGERKTMRAEDITPELLQKGMDYDRVREQYDQAKPIMSLVSALAGDAGVSVEEYMRMVRTETKRSEGMNEDEAKRAIVLEDREAAVKAKEEAQRKAADDKKQGDAQIQQNLAEFAKAFPEVYAQAQKDTGAIPDSVWADVSEGLSLTAAYAKYAVAEAEKMVQAAEHKAQAADQNQKNTQRTTGSLSSTGSDTKNKDPFLEGWGD